MTTRRWRGFATPRAIPWVFLIGGFALYAASASPGLAILDSGEFLGVAATLGIAHPTGYPLYALLGHLFAFSPWGTQAFCINLASAAAGAFAAFALALAALEYARLIGARAAAAACGALAAGVLVLLGRTLWSVATLAEVYALNAFFWAALAWAALRLRRTAAPGDLLLLALLGGLAMANHMTIGLMVAAAVVLAWPGRDRAKPLVKFIPLAAALFLLGCSVNLYAPLRAASHPVFNWNDPSTLKFWFHHVAALQYRCNFWDAGFAGATFALRKFIYDFPANVAPLSAFALVAVARGIKKGFRLLTAGFLAYAVAYMAYCCVYDIPDIDYYFIPFYLWAAFFTATGITICVQFLGARGRPTVGRAAAWVAAAMVIASGVWLGVRNIPYGDRHSFRFAETLGTRLLRPLPYRALIFPSGDTNTFICWYNVYAARRRPDVAVVDQVRLVSHGYLTALAARHSDLTIPPEAEIQPTIDRAVARGDFLPEGIVFQCSDDFILPELLTTIIADNIPRRPMFWGLGDPGEKLRPYIVPYELVMQIMMEPPPPAEMTARAEASVRALNRLVADTARTGPDEMRDLFFRDLMAVYYRGLSGYLLNWWILGPEVELFRGYISYFPDDVNGYQNLGWVYALMGKPAEAARYFRLALKVSPKDNVIRGRLIQALVASGQPREAARVIADFKSAAPGETEYLQGIVYRENGDLTRARRAFDAAAPHYQKNPTFWMEKGRTEDAAGDNVAAVASYTRAAALEPRDPFPLAARGIAYLRMDNLDAAAADLESALALRPGDAQAQYNLACVYARRGQPGMAMDHLEAAVKLNPARYVPMAKKDPDLASCRGSAAFDRLLAAGGP